MEIIPEEGVFLLTEHGHTVLTGRLYECVVPFIDGNRTADDICDNLTDKLSAAEVYYTLNLLEKKGHIIEGKGLPSSGTMASWTANGIDPADAQRALDQKTITVKSFGDFPMGPFYDVLQEHGITISDDGEFEVVLADEYLRSDLNDYNNQF